MMGPASADRLLKDRQSPLVEDAARGDPEALAVLLGAARSTVKAWVSERTQDQDDAEDITQMVLLRVFKGIGKFRGESRLSSWLYRITANELSGFYRKRDLERRAVLAWLEAGIRPAVTRPDPEAIDRKRILGRIRDAAETLPPFQSSLFRLIDLGGMRPCEAALELGKTQTNIRSNLSRARRKIRELVREAR